MKFGEEIGVVRTIIPASNCRGLFSGGFIKQLFADAQVGVADFCRQIGGEIVHQTIAKLRIRVAQHDELIAGDDKEVGIFLSGDRSRRAEAFVDERDLAEGLSAAEGGDQEVFLSPRLTRFGGGTDADVYFALRDDVEFLAPAVLAEYDLAFIEHYFLTQIRNQLQLGGGELVEGVALFQIIDDVCGCHVDFRFKG